MIDFELYPDYDINENEEVFRITENGTEFIGYVSNKEKGQDND